MAVNPISLGVDQNWSNNREPFVLNKGRVEKQDQVAEDLYFISAELTGLIRELSEERSSQYLAQNGPGNCTPGTPVPPTTTPPRPPDVYAVSPAYIRKPNQLNRITLTIIGDYLPYSNQIERIELTNQSGSRLNVEGFFRDPSWNGRKKITLTVVLDQNVSLGIYKLRIIRKNQSSIEKNDIFEVIDRNQPAPSPLPSRVFPESTVANNQPINVLLTGEKADKISVVRLVDQNNNLVANLASVETPDRQMRSFSLQLDPDQLVSHGPVVLAGGHGKRYNFSIVVAYSDGTPETSYPFTVIDDRRPPLTTFVIPATIAVNDRSQLVSIVGEDMGSVTRIRVVTPNDRVDLIDPINITPDQISADKKRVTIALRVDPKRIVGSRSYQASMIVEYGNREEIWPLTLVNDSLSLGLIVSPTTLLANNQSQTLHVVGDNVGSVKIIRLTVPATGVNAIEPIIVSQEMIFDNNRRISIPITLDPIKFAALFPDRVAGPFRLNIVALDAAGTHIAGLNDVTIVIIQDRTIVRQVPYQLSPVLHDVVRPTASLGVSVQENSSSVPLILGFNPQLIGKTGAIKSEYVEFSGRGDCSFFSGEVIDGCQAQGYINISYWGFKLESAGQAKYATSGSVYNLPYYYERSSFMTDGRFSLSYIPGKALTVRASGEWSYTKTMDDQRDGRFRLSGDGFITFGDGRSVYLPEKLNLHFGLVPSGERVIAGEGRQLRGGGVGFDARWDRGIFDGLPLGLYFGWERISSAGESNPHNLYGGVNFDLMRFVDRTVGYQDFSKYILTQQR
ncbi:MAG: hypothetical protein KKC80_05240 [Candidatus Margulisbacteria bacterium]|nr:hypothetical protein [Candidatus Margulisiibacteriota bacterium]MBU1616609.1 hypothetical protein [Candidatus Margulisiibacteriota bacterium]